MAYVIPETRWQRDAVRRGVDRLLARLQASSARRTRVDTTANPYTDGERNYSAFIVEPVTQPLSDELEQLKRATSAQCTFDTATRLKMLVPHEHFYATDAPALVSPLWLLVHALVVGALVFIGLGGGA